MGNTIPDPHSSKLPTKSNLRNAISAIRSDQARERKRKSMLKAFDNLPLSERQFRFTKYRGRKLSLFYIKDYDKLDIMGYFK